MLFVTDTSYPPGSKKTVLVYGQEHSNEQNGALECQGLVDFLVSGDATAQSLLQNMIFIIIPDICPDATYAGITNDSDNGQSAEWRYKPAAIERMMPGMSVPMTLESKAVWNRIDQFVNSGNQIDFVINLHQGGMDNWYGVFELADPAADNFDEFMRNKMPVSGASWVPNNAQGYSRGGWQNVLPSAWPIIRILGRCREEWRTTAMGYEISVGARANNFLNNMSGIKYFGKALALAFYDYYGSFNKSLTISSPNGGETLSSGGTTNVTWTSAGAPGNIRIDCSTDGGSAWQNLVSSTINDGNETVTLPTGNSNNCILRISSVTAVGINDISNAVFTVGTAPVSTITVTYPNGGEAIDSYYRKNITWTSTGTLSKINIEVSTNGGTSWKRMAYAVPNSNSYEINIPGEVSNQCLIKVTNAENLSVNDVSNAFFITQEQSLPTLDILYPNGAEVLLPGSAVTVTWLSSGFTTNVGIRLSTDEGANWNTLSSSTPNDGSENVTLPVVNSSKCIIWVYEATTDAYINQPSAFPLDISNNLFSICNAPTVTSTTESSRCGTDTLILGATADEGTINWYLISTGGSSLGTGTSFTTPDLTSTTSYYVDATNNGCTSLTRTTVTADITCNQTDSITSSDLIKAYPNPTTGKFKISIDESIEADYTIELFNNLAVLMQKILITKNENISEIDLSNYPDGIYLIKIYSKKDNFLYKIIKQ